MLTAAVRWPAAGQVHVLKQAHHPCICMFMGCALDPPTYCVVLEYMEGGSLYAALRRPNAVSRNLRAPNRSTPSPLPQECVCTYICRQTTILPQRRPR